MLANKLEIGIMQYRYRLFVTLAALAIGLLVSTPIAVQAQAPSPGCSLLNDPFFDSFYASAFFAQAKDFFGGELITVTAGPPDSGNPSTIFLQFDGTDVASTPYPGTLTYRVPSNVTAVAKVGVNAGGASFNVNCAANNPPSASDDSFSVPQDTPATLDVAANDTDPEGNLDPSTVNVLSGPSHGAAVGNGDGTVTYTPDSGFTGGDSFTYEICDTGDLCDQANVAIDVLVVNEPPNCAGVAPNPDTLWPPNHQGVAVGLSGASDPDGDPLTLVIDSISSNEPENGTGDGDMAPDSGGVGTDTAMLRAERAGGGSDRVYTIGFTVSDGQGGACTGSVEVRVPHDSSAGDSNTSGGEQPQVNTTDTSTSQQVQTSASGDSGGSEIIIVPPSDTGNGNGKGKGNN